MRSRAWIVALCVLMIAGLRAGHGSAAASTKPPNLLVIMTDNHGAWTLGCYGNPDVLTPNIDSLAREGMLFTRAFASNPVCSPTRATFLTGLLPSQHGVHCYLRAGRLQMGPQARNTLAELTSLGEILRDAGYDCGLVGKWHLGDNLRPQEGFDAAWVTMPHGATSTFYGAEVIEGGQVRREEGYLTDFWTRRAVDFLRRRKDADRPFFLMVAYNGPYALGRLLLRDGRNRFAPFYANKTLPSFPREPVHTWQHANRDYINNPTSIRRVATEVSGVDDGVGEILATLSECGLDENTLVVFTADQGWVGGQGGFWGMGDHTQPVTGFDGMLRVPMIWRHAGRIPAGERCDLIVTNYDFLPTVLNYLGLAERLPQRPRSPGRDFSPVLAGGAPPRWSNEAFFEFEFMRGIRTEQFKYIHRHPNGPTELYDLQSDPGEQVNLAGDPQYAQVQRRLHKRLTEFFRQYAEPRYDLWRGGGSQTLLLTQRQAPLPEPAPVEEPVDPNFRIPPIHVPAGYTVELAAGPPLVEHPMMACFDDRGRLFVAESAGLNLPAKELEERRPNLIRMLEDRDRDGRFDRSTVFADGLTFPQGALWHDGALYVASPPYLWRLEDTDGDGVADRRQPLVGQFGYTGNAADIHGPFLGPDGRLYWCDGRHGHEFRDAAGRVVSKGDGSYIFSCRPDGSDPRPFCGGGMDNPVEVDFTDEGEMLGTVNILYRQPRVDCLVHWLYGGVYPHSERVLGEFRRTGPLLGPVHGFGHVAVSGTTRYRSGVLDRAMRDDWLVAVFNLGQVVRVKLDREGATFRAREQKLLSCDSRDFHPTDVLEDADGSLLVIDTGGWFRIGCPTSQIAKPEIRGAIYRVRRQGVTPLVDPWGEQIDWPKLEADQLVRLLNDTRWKVRERAIAECARRGDAAVPQLARVVRSGDSRPKQNAVWALVRIDSPAARKALRAALDDPLPRIRLTACRAISTSCDQQAVPRLVELLGDEDAAVRREAATALGRIGARSAVAALLAGLARPIDRAEEHARIYAVMEIGDVQQIARGLDDPATAVRRGALIALDQLGAPLDAARVVAMLDSDDALLRDAAVDVISRRPSWAPAVAGWLKGHVDPERWTAARAGELRRLIAALGGQPPVAAWVGHVLADPAAPRPLKRTLLEAIGQGSSVPLHPSWVEPLEQLAQSDDEQLAQLALQAIASIDSKRFDGLLQAIAADASRPVLVRVAALEAAAGNDRRLSPAAFDLLIELLNPEASGTERLRAAQLIGNSQLTRPQLLRLADQLASAGPLEIKELIRPFTGNTDAEVGRRLLRAVEQAPGFWNLLPTELWQTVHRAPPEVSEAAKPLVERLRAQQEQKQQRLAELLPLVQHGDARRGGSGVSQPKRTLHGVPPRRQRGGVGRSRSVAHRTNPLDGRSAGGDRFPVDQLRARVSTLYGHHIARAIVQWHHRPRDAGDDLRADASGRADRDRPGPDRTDRAQHGVDHAAGARQNAGRPAAG